MSYVAVLTYFSGHDCEAEAETRIVGRFTTNELAHQAALRAEFLANVHSGWKDDGNAKMYVLNYAMLGGKTIDLKAWCAARETALGDSVVGIYGNGYRFKVEFHEEQASLPPLTDQERRDTRHAERLVRAFSV